MKNSKAKRWAVATSLAVHAALLVVLMFWYLPKHRTADTMSSPVPESASVDSQPPAPPKAPEPSPPEPSSPATATPEPANVPDDQIRASVESQLEQTQRLPDEKKLSELEKNLRRLDSIADEQSVRQTSSAIAESLGLDTQAYAAKAAPDSGTFDPATAQIDDVVRTGDEQSGWRYESVMVDAAGHTMTVPLAEAEGARLYETFELMKRYPTARGIYQGVVMPMIQKMLAAESQGGQPQDGDAALSPGENRVIKPEVPKDANGR